MNICFFSDVHISKFRGGVERVTNLLSEALQRKGYSITMLSVLSPTENDSLEKNQFVLPNKNVCSQENIEFASELFKTKNIDIIINQSETLSTYKLLKESREKQALITCIHNDPATMIKAIDDQWDLWRINHGDLKYFFLYPYIYLRKILQRHFRLEYVRDKYSKHYQESDAIILLSDKYIDVFKKITRIEDCKKIHIIPNPTLFYQLNSNNEKENIVLFVGRLVYQKRIDRLLKIWNKTKKGTDWKLIIVGDGKDLDFFKDINRRIGNSNVEFVGLQEPTYYYQKSKILCMVSSYEGSPCVIQEALYHNVIPIIFNSFEAGGDYIINSKTGFLIEPYNIDKYAKILTELINGNNIIQEMQNNIKKENYQDIFSKEKIIQQWEQLFKKLK